MDSAKKVFVLFLVLLLAIEVVTLKPYITSPNVQNYKGDEVWYVDAARNYLHKDGINVFYTHEVEYTQNGKLYKIVNYGANVLLRVPDINEKFNEELKSRVVEGDPNAVYQLLPQIYNFDNPAYAPYENQIFSEANITGATKVEGVHQKALNIGYFLFPSKKQILDLQKVAENYRAPENITVTLHYQVPAQGPNGHVTYVTKTLKFIAYTKGQKMFDVVPGFFYGDQFGIEKYYNLEHPFLVKAILIGDMRLFGDNPWAWRIPSLISYLLILIIVALAVRELTGSYFWASVAALLVGIDPGLRMLGATAMLDIFVTLFSTLAMYAMVKKQIGWASFWIGVATAAKPNGVFIFLAILLYVAYYAIEKVNGTTKEKAIKFIVDSLKYGTIAATAFVAFNLPILAFLSLDEWWNGLFHAIAWNLSYKGPQPFTSPIWNWFFNRNPFTIYFDPRIMIQTNWFLWDLAALFSILYFLVPKIYPRKDKRTSLALVAAGAWSIVAMYLLMYLLGGISQYSYYSVQLTPFWIVIFSTLIAYFIDWSKIKGTFFEEYVKPAFDEDSPAKGE